MDVLRLLATTTLLISCASQSTQTPADSTNVTVTIIDGGPIAGNLDDMVSSLADIVDQVHGAVLSGTTTQNDDNSTASTTISPTNVTEINCATAKGVNGTCVPRQSCDYSTPAIDLTLYAPSWYQKPCLPEEVCCPIDSIVIVQPSAGSNDDDFSFDDDD